jgi:hypothetical protein
MAKLANKVERVEEGSGNAIADMRLSVAAELSTKGEPTIAIKLSEY